MHGNGAWGGGGREGGVVKHFGAFFLEVVVEMQLKSWMSNGVWALAIP